MAEPTKTTTEPQAPPTYSPEAGKVAIYDRDGSVWKVPEADLPKALSEGARPATEAEYWSEKHGRTATGTAAFGVGAARSLGEMAGLPTDAMAIGGAGLIGGEEAKQGTRRTLNLLKEAHPIATEAGETAGMIAPMFFGAGEAGLAARGGRALPRVIRAGVEAGVQGIEMGVAHQANEDALGDHEYNAANYATAGFKGGAMGVILGTGLTHLGGKAATTKSALGERFFGRGAVQEAEALAEHDAQTWAARELPNPPREPLADYGVSPGFEGEMARGAPRAPGAIAPSVEGEALGVSPGLGADLGEGGAIVPERVPNREQRRGGVEQGLFPNEFPNVPERATKIEPRMPGGVSAGEAPSRAPSFFDTEAAMSPGVGARTETAFPKGERMPGGAVRSVETDLLTAARPGIGGEARAAEEGFNVSPSLEGRASLGRGPLASDATRAVEEVGPSVRDRLAASREAGREAAIQELENRTTIDSLKKASDRQAFQATGAKMGDLRKMGGSAQDQQLAMERAGATLKREVGVQSFDTADSLNKRLVKKLDEVGSSIPKLYKELDQAVERPSLDRIFTRYEGEVRQPTLRDMFGDKEIGMADDAVSRMKTKLGTRPTFNKMWEVRREIDGELYKHFERPKGMGEASIPYGETSLRKLRDIITEEMDVAAERASMEMGTDTAQRLRFANETYRDLRLVKDITTRESARGIGNHRISITDVIAGAGGGPLAVIGNHVRRQYGNAIASNVLERATRLKAVQDASAKVDDLLNKRTRAFVAGEKPKDLRPMRTMTAKEVSDIHKQVSNAAAVRANTEQALGDLGKYAPKTATAFSLHVARLASYLAQSLPKTTPPPGLVFTRPKDRPLSDSDLRRAAAIVETVEDPSIVVDRLLQGRLTKDHVVALKIGSPTNYQKIRSYLNDHAIDLRPQMDVQDQISLSILFQMPVAEVMKRANVTALQASFVGGNQAPKQGTSAALGPTSVQMAAGPIKGGGQSATYWSEFAKPTR